MSAQMQTSHFTAALNHLLRVADSKILNLSRYPDEVSDLGGKAMNITFQLSWQIVPRQLGELLGDPDPQKAQRVMQAMLQMNKIDIAALQAAYDGHNQTKFCVSCDTCSQRSKQ